MAGIQLIGGKETAYQLQQLARHQMMLRLYNDIRQDLVVCEIEGWDKTEYIRMLQDTLNHFTVKEGDHNGESQKTCRSSERSLNSSDTTAETAGRAGS